MFVPHRQHITSLLRAQQINAIYRLVTMVYWYNYYNSGYYSSSCFLFKTHDGCSYLTGNTSCLCYEPSRLMRSICLWRWYSNITIAILDIIHRTVFHLRSMFSETGLCLDFRWSSWSGDRLTLSIGLNWFGITWKQRRILSPKHSVLNRRVEWNRRE
jgi:hypothetical protein